MGCGDTGPHGRRPDVAGGAVAREARARIPELAKHEVIAVLDHDLVPDGSRNSDDSGIAISRAGLGLGVAVEDAVSEKGLLGLLHRRFFAYPSQRFAVASVLLLITLAIAPTKDFFNEWRQYKRRYRRFAPRRR